MNDVCGLIRKRVLHAFQATSGLIVAGWRAIHDGAFGQLSSTLDQRVDSPQASKPSMASWGDVSDVADPAPISFDSHLDPHHTFSTFVETKSNRLGKAAAMRMAQNPGHAYNPLLLYGDTGVGKTHLLHAAGNLMRERNPRCKVLYLRSEQCVGETIEALRTDGMNEFKRRFCSVDALLVDDIQFFAGKDATQETFLHVFNTLFDFKHVILAFGCYPKNADKLDRHLRSHLGGLSVAIEPPDFETRVAILLAKAHDKGVPVSKDVAMLLAKRIRSNVRDLEGALNSLVALAHFYGRPITLELAEETLRDSWPI